jgi:hypothetical protein
MQFKILIPARSTSRRKYKMMHEPTRVKRLSGSPLKGRLPALRIDIRQGCKGLPGTNTLAYYKNFKITGIKNRQ